jgi:hypothetical protein
MLDAGCWMLDARYWMLDTGCSILDAGCWMLDTGCSILDAGCWILNAGNGRYRVEGKREELSAHGAQLRADVRCWILDKIRNRFLLISSIEKPVSRSEYPGSGSFEAQTLIKYKFHYCCSRK